MTTKTEAKGDSDKQRVYRSDAFSRACRGVAIVGALAILLLMVSPRQKTRVLPIEALGLGFAAWAGIKVPRCGVYLEDGGVRVLNPFSTVSLKWSEIARFEFRDYGPCAVKRVHGRTVTITGIQQSAWAARRGIANTQSANLIVELNALLETHRAATK
jgi:hypothetical protein